MHSSKKFFIASVATALVSFVGASSAFAATQPPVRPTHDRPVVGTVTAVNGATVTIETRVRPTPAALAAARAQKTKPSVLARSAAAMQSMTVDLSTAKIFKGKASGKVSDIAIGDRVLVLGTITDTSITAHTVRDSGAARTPTKKP